DRLVEHGRAERVEDRRRAGIAKFGAAIPQHDPAIACGGIVARPAVSRQAYGRELPQCFDESKRAELAAVRQSARQQSGNDEDRHWAREQGALRESDVREGRIESSLNSV